MSQSASIRNLTDKRISILTTFSTRLQQVAQHPEVFRQYARGLERETLRYTDGGELALTPHPQILGSALTNSWITTDFSESLLEFITPVSHEVPTLLSQLEDIHHFTQSHLGNENLWPLSMPCYVRHEDDIQLAQYGTSNNGRMKTLYREGLKRRYGSLMQIISGVHFNFSFPDSFWDVLYGKQTEEDRQAVRSEAYFAVIRNYYRFGWLIPYFFGASPAICSSFLQGRETRLPFENINNSLYLPYATSLRLSDLGYTNHSQSELKIGFNSLNQYLEGLNRAIHTPSAEFASIGVKVEGEYRQLNTNVLQIENELYAPIRPKRVAKRNEKPSEALCRGGVEYIEVRSLDVNPLSPIGITEDQVRFLDLFITWTALTDSDPMDNCELECWRDNWRKVVLEGRQPGLELQIGCKGEKLSLQAWAKRVFSDLKLIAELMDAELGGSEYLDICRKLESWIDQPELTLSGQIMDMTRQAGGIKGLGTSLGEQHRQANLSRGYHIYSETMMLEEAEHSRQTQIELEAQDTLSFDAFLEDYFSGLKV